MSLPVVFIHKGSCDYLYHTIYQLQQASPGTPLYLIGTAETQMYKGLVFHERIEDYSEEAEPFAALYQHFSTNGYAFELFCLQRWFILEAFMRTKGIEQCLYLDSDVLVYSPVDALSTTYGHTGMSLCGISGHSNFVRLQVLEDFCRYVTDAYSGEAAILRLKDYYTAVLREQPVGGVSDMTLLTWFAASHPNDVLNTWLPDQDETFDPSMEVGKEFFMMEDSVKQIRFHQHIPFGINRLSTKSVRFHTLHFQGGIYKRLMGRYVQNKTWEYYLRLLYFKVVLLAQKILRKIK